MHRTPDDAKDVIMEDDLDTHICLGCQMTVIGLDQYIQHKQLHCPARKNFLPSPSSSTATLCVDIDETELSASLLSPVAGRVVDPNMVLSRKPSAVSEFFSSLELQCRPLMEKLEEGVTKTCGNDDEDEMMDQQKALKIASILSDLEFSSDSEVLTIDDNLLDFSDNDVDDDGGDDEDEDNGDDSLPPTHIGGKWKPGAGPNFQEVASAKSSGKVGSRWVKGERQNMSRGGKWRPGEQPGKLSAYYKRATHGQGRCGKLEAYLAQDDTKGAVPEHRKSKRLDSASEEISANNDVVALVKSTVDVNRSEDHLTGLPHVEDLFIAEARYKAARYAEKQKVAQDIVVENNHVVNDPVHEKFTTNNEEIDQTSKKDLNSTEHAIIENDITEEEEERSFATVNVNDDAAKYVNKNELKCESSTAFEEKNSQATAEDGDNTIDKADDLTCRLCKRHFSRVTTYHKHFESKLHAKRHAEARLAKLETKNILINDDDDAHEDVDPKISENLPTVVVDIDCPICWKHFTNKYNFIRHLLTTYHLRRVHQSNEPFVLAECYQIQLLRQSTKFQCRICSFYCQEERYLCEHISSNEHVSHAGSLMGPQFCTRCRFKTRDNQVMLNHLKTVQHDKCVVRELRFRVECAVCGRILHSAAQLTSHMKAHHKRHTKDGQLCSHCGVHFTSVVRLARHVRQRHTRPHHCQPCGASFADAYTLRLHASSKRHLDNCLRLGSSGKAVMPASSAGQFKCDHCAFTTAEYSRLRPHYMRVHAGHAHACNVCGRTFASRQQYSVHMASARHKQRELEAAAESADVHTCTACGLKFYSAQQFALHEMTHANMVSERTLKSTQGNEYPGVDERYHIFLRDLQPRTRRVTCPECGRSLARANLIPHLRQHSGAMMFRCVLCERGYASAGALRRHLQAHSGVVAHACPVCARTFPRRSSLMTHQLRKHPDHACVQEMTTYPCKACGMLFHAKHLLKTHTRTHDADMPYKCTYAGCGRAFCQSGALKTHMLTHTPLRPFLCSTCGYSARTRQQLTRHMRVHTGERRYLCEHCPYRAASATHLRRHTRVHAGACPFKCPYCSYRCNTHENLRKHVLRTRRHIGKPVYPCSKCEFGTNDARELREHLINAHNVDRRGLVMSIQAGIYDREADVQHVAEGAQVIAVRERGKRMRTRKPTRTDHDYTVAPIALPQSLERIMTELVSENTSINNDVNDTILDEMVVNNTVVDEMVITDDMNVVMKQEKPHLLA